MSVEVRLHRYNKGVSVETVDLNDLSTSLLLNYGLRSASKETMTVTESAEVLLIGGVAAAQTKLKAIETLLFLAGERSERRAGDRIYIERKVSEADGWWRAEIKSGLVSPMPETIDQVRTGALQFSVSLTRENGWDGEEAQMPLTNGNGADNLSGLTVYALDDEQAGRDNWVAINGGLIGGDLPARTRIEITNSYNDSGRTGIVRMALNWRSEPSTLAHILEGENFNAYWGTPPSVLPAVADLSLYSHGQCVQRNVGATQTGVCWALTNDFLQKCNGNFFKVIGRFTWAPTLCWVKLRITLAGLTAIYDGPWVMLHTSGVVQSNYLAELDTLRLPPYLAESGALGELQLELLFKRPAGNDHVDLDYLALLTTDGWRKVEHLGYDLGYTTTLVDDGINGMVYTIWPEGIFGYQSPSGKPIELMPGRAQRLYILAAGSDLPQRTSTVKLFYRPRKLTL